jgi:glycosyltransferase involved in cell wall biosynthesis
VVLGVNCEPLTVNSSKRLAWFSPLAPARTGIAAYTAELLAYLERDFTIDCYDESRAHDFVWTARRHPYQLTVYHLGNAPCHDFMWGYLAAYPGLVVLHDARLHHARARQLLAAKRDDDYRREFRYDHPDAGADVAEYFVAAMGGVVQYFWPMRRLVLRTARRVAVHNASVAAELRRDEPHAAIDTIRMGVPPIEPSHAARTQVRARLGIADAAVVFTAFGKMTAEKRPSAMLMALDVLAGEGLDVHLLLVGEDSVGVGAHPRVHATGYVGDADVPACLLASDVCLCLRWPTALETSASWLRCLAAARATIVTDLAHTADVPADVAPRVDVIDEVPSLVGAMRRLAVDAASRDRFARTGHAWWRTHHTMEMMAEDYRRTIAAAIETPAPAPADLPSHVTNDYSGTARALTNALGVTVDILR